MSKKVQQGFFFSVNEIPAVNHYRFFSASSFISDKTHKIQEITGIIRNPMIRPGYVLDLRELTILVFLEKKNYI